ncbi:MAG: ABC-F family ATP-binding cassette domain-containing protein [Blastocatellia bacterium]|nr:ABC-F family ATP-binding cassette domain-containing protein [Blastocatellia bacterium]
MNLLSLHQLSKTYDIKPILQDVTLAVDDTERVGIIGSNGSGKTTLFRLIEGTVTPDAGTISVRRGISLGLLAQEPHLTPNRTVQEVIDASLVEVRQVAAAFEQLSEKMAAAQNETELSQLHEEYEAVEHRMEQLGGWNYQHRIDAILGHLDIRRSAQAVESLSGGERKRVALACTFIRNPELLILDEPTNHLDVQTIAWLEAYLDEYKGALLLITHDRYFLDNIVDRMVEIADGTATTYRGGYSDYLEARAEREEIEDRTHSRLLGLLRREEAWLRRGVRARGTKSKHRIRTVLEMREQARREQEEFMRGGITSAQRLGNTILETKDLKVECAGIRLVENLEFILNKGDRIALVGPNGSGKTTLLRTLIGQIPPTAGTVTQGKNTSFAYFAQNRLDLDQELTVWDYINGNAEMVNVRGEFRTIRSYLRDFKFGNDHLHSKIKLLSGGEKNRLVLAKILLTDANVLVLDEPTNDLDIETLQWIEATLNDFQGCVLFVTHDRFFLDKVATGLLVFEGNGQVTKHAGNFSLYQQLKAIADEEAKAQSAPPPALKTQAPEVKKQRTGLSYKEKQELEQLEVKLAELEAEKKSLEEQLSNPELSGIGSNYQKLAEIGLTLDALHAEIDRCSERWLELEERNQ